MMMYLGRLSRVDKWGRRRLLSFLCVQEDSIARERERSENIQKEKKEPD